MPLIQTSNVDDSNLIESTGFLVDTVDGSEIRLTSWYVVYPIIYKVLAPSQVAVWDFWSPPHSKNSKKQRN